MCLVSQLLCVMPGFVTPAHGILLDHLDLAANGACACGYHGTLTNGETIFGQLPPPGHSADSRLNCTLGLSGKDAHVLVTEL